MQLSSLQLSKTDKKPDRKKQWLWFVGIYIVSVAVVAGVVTLLRLLILHL